MESTLYEIVLVYKLEKMAIMTCALRKLHSRYKALIYIIQIKAKQP